MMSSYTIRATISLEEESGQMIIGYSRVSKNEQLTALQVDAMKSANCERTFTDKMTGKRFDRPEFLKMLDMLRPGDILVVGDWIG
jgi:DNA invertase Pin-like site-specific DNA recombinase